MADKDLRSEEKMLETLFASARLDRATPDENLARKLEADMHRSVPAKPERQQLDNPGHFTRLGNLFAASGLAGAAAAGVWIGFAMPELINGLAFDEQSSGYGIEAIVPAAGLAAMND